MKLTLSNVEDIVRADASDSAKITTLLSFFEPSKEKLSLLRGLSHEQVESHLRACGKQAQEANQEPEQELTLMTLASLYAQRYRQKFGTWTDQPNIRVVLRKAIQRFGMKKTDALLWSFMEQARNVEEARIARFYSLHVNVPTKTGK